MAPRSHEGVLVKMLNEQFRGVDPARGLGSTEAGQCLLRHVTSHVALDKSFVISGVGVTPGVAVGMTELIVRVQCSEQRVWALPRHTAFVTGTTPTPCSTLDLQKGQRRARGWL